MTMKTLQYRNGDPMPALGLGTWKSEPGEVGDAVDAALRMGYRHFDCAAIYGNESEIGTALIAAPVAREELWITSKLWNDRHATEDVRPALEQTLRDLQLDYLDLYLVHWPISLRKGVWLPERGSDLISPEELPLSETWAAMEATVDAGLCRHIGLSNCSVAKLESLKDARIPPEADQVELHPYLQQPELLEYCKAHGIVLTGYSPLGSRDRPERLKAADEPTLLEDATIGAIAERLTTTPAQVLLAWALQRGTAAIPKSVSPERLKQNLAASELTLPDTDMHAITALDRSRRYISGSFWAMEGSPYTLANLWDE